MRQKLKKILYVLIPVTSIITALCLYISNESDTLQSVKWEHINPEAVDSIIIEGKNEKIILNRKIENWTINHHYNADVKSVYKLFSILNNIEIISRSKKELTTDLLPVYQNIIIYKNKKAFSVFICCDSINRNIISFNKKNYFIRLAGFDKCIADLIAEEEGLFRDKKVLKHLTNEIRIISIHDYNRKDSFSIILDNDNTWKKLDKTVNQNKVRAYISSLKNLKVSEFINVPLPDLVPEKIYEVECLESNGRKELMSFYGKLDKRGKIDYDHVYMIINKKDSYLMSFIEVVPILKKQSFFEEGE